MAKTRAGWLPVGTGIVVTVMALWVATTISAAEETAPEVASVTTADTATPSTITLPPVVITTPPPELDGLSESVARVLATEGFASELTESDIASQLPASVYRTLVANHVVLSVATEDPGQ